MTGPRPRLAMVVMNSITADSRVKKAAATAVRAGCDTRVFGIDATPWTTSLGGAVLERVAPDRRRPPLLTRSGGRWTLAPLAPLAYRDHKTMLRHARDLPESADRTPVSRARRFVHRFRRRLLHSGPTLSFGRVDPECLETFIERRLPHLRAESIALADAVAAFGPDLIHAHDVTAMQIPRLIEERHCQTIPWVYDAHELVRGLTSARPRVDQALVDLEAWLAPAAADVLAVSEPLGETLAVEHGLQRTPRIVLNAPPRADLAGDSIRASCGLGPDEVLLVYPGVVKPARGLETVIEMLKLSDSVHLALVTDPIAAPLEGLLELARRCGVEHRVHVRPYVEAHRVSAFLRDGTIGVHPISHYANAEIALPTKLFEFLQAGLPVVVSGVAAMSDFVHRHGVGVTFEAGNPVSLHDAVQTVVERRPFFVAQITPQLQSAVSWEAQEDVLVAAYASASGMTLELSPERATLSLSEERRP